MTPPWGLAGGHPGGFGGFNLGDVAEPFVGLSADSAPARRSKSSLLAPAAMAHPPSLIDEGSISVELMWSWR